MAIYPVTEQLVIVRRPSRERPSEDIAEWRRAGVTLVVSLLEPPESHELGLEQEAAFCEAAGVSFVNFPIRDRSTPSSQVAIRTLTDRLAAHQAAGGVVGVHCRASIGRTGLLLASLLVREGLEVSAAFERITKARGVECPDTPEQVVWVEDFRTYLADLPPDPFKAAAPASVAPR